MENEFEKDNEKVTLLQPEAAEPAPEAVEPTSEEPAAFCPTETPVAQYTPAPQEKKKKKKKKGGAKIVALALCFSLLGGAIGAGGVLLWQDSSGNRKGGSQSDYTGVLEGLRENVIIDINKVNTSKLMTAAEVYAVNVNATVSIETTYKPNMWGQNTGGSAGSGFILTNDGYILTNYHVVEDAYKINVLLYSGETHAAKIIGYNEQNDIAVLKINATDLAPVILGDSKNLNVGDSVVAIGNPLGELPFTLTTGIVSGMDRKITMSDGLTMQLLQTDCPINSGNSGGALFNMYGEVIGITNAKFSTGTGSGQASIDNIGFAIPINQVRDMVFSIIEKGYVAKPYIGITVSTVTQQMQNWGIPEGALVEEVETESPAAQAGLRPNDIITHIDGTAVKTHSELVLLVGQKTIGSSVKLTVYRNREVMEITIVLGEQIQAN